MYNIRYEIYNTEELMKEFASGHVKSKNDCEK